MVYGLFSGNGSWMFQKAGSILWNDSTSPPLTPLQPLFYLRSWSGSNHETSNPVPAWHRRATKLADRPVIRQVRVSARVSGADSRHDFQDIASAERSGCRDSGGGLIEPRIDLALAPLKKARSGGALVC